MSGLRETRSGYAADNLSPEDRAASEWALRARRELTPSEEKEFERWLAQDPTRAARFAELEATSRLLDRLRDSGPVFASLQPEGTEAPARAVVGRRRVAAVMLATAAAVALAWAGWWRFNELRIANGFFHETVATNARKTRQIQLPDRSIVEISPTTVLEFQFTPTERRVRLKQGEAYFTVAKNPDRPFFVETDRIVVRAVGTAFNVRHRAQSVEVIVTEGRVSVEQGGQTLLPSPATSASANADRLLLAGEKAVIALPAAGLPAVDAPAAAAVRPAVATVEDWQSNRLEFIDTPLPEVIAEFNRHNSHKLVIGDPALMHRTFGGAFSPTGYRALVEVLEQSFGVVAEKRTGETVLRKAP